MSRREPRSPWRMRRAALAAVVTSAAVLTLAGATSGVWGAFSGQTQSAGNELRASADWVAPTATAAVIQKVEGGVTGYIRQGGGYRVYVSATDSGKPPSGVAAGSVDAGAITSGATAAPLSLGSFSVAGQSYNLGSTSLTAKSVLSEGSYSYAATVADAAGNTRSQGGYSVVVDNAAPAGTAIQAANKTGGIAGRPEAGDTITFTFSEPIDPNSIVSGWTAGATNVVVDILNNASGPRDQLIVTDATNTATLPLGSVDLGRNDYVTANTTFGASGTPSTLTQSANAITVVLGTAAVGARTAAGSGTMSWSPATAATDRAGNAVASGAVLETGTADAEF